MLAKWEFLVSRDFNLPVVDSGGVSRTAHALQKGDMKRQTDLMELSVYFIPQLLIEFGVNLMRIYARNATL